jgi:ATP-binding cassette subfamily B protein
LEDAPDAQPLPDPRRASHLGEPGGGRVEFRQVSFRYQPDRPVLHDLSFVAEPGQMIALVGQTGSGKSTVTHLLGKLYLPASGRILIDNRDVLTLTSTSLHQQMAFITQSNFLFTGTILDNIRFGRPEATDAEIIAVCERLGCREVIEGLPRGFETLTGERGLSLSLGQRQLVCFARALAANPRILVLDEATSSLDAFTEARLQKALATLLVGRTSFVVAHRLSTIVRADQILVLERGRLVESGNHASLLARRGHYERLYHQLVVGEERA